MARDDVVGTGRASEARGGARAAGDVLGARVTRRRAVALAGAAAGCAAGACLLGGLGAPWGSRAGAPAASGPARAFAADVPYQVRTSRPEAGAAWYYSDANPYYAATVDGEGRYAPTPSLAPGADDADGEVGAASAASDAGSGAGPTYVTGGDLWYAWGRASEALGEAVALPCTGAAGWLDRAGACGYEVGATPRYGSIMVSRPDGHVAFVEYVGDDGTAYVSESANGTSTTAPTADTVSFHFGPQGDWTPVGSDVSYIHLFADPDLPATGYYDVAEDSWYYRGGYVGYVTEAGIMTGATDASGNLTRRFMPEDDVTRGQVATILYRLGTDDANGGSGTTSDFVDVSDSYCTWAVQWCYLKGVVTGYTDAAGRRTGYFGPDAPITREQFAAMLYRFAAAMGAPTDADESVLDGIDGRAQVSAYAITPMAWCYRHGILTGSVWADGSVHLLPQDNATRAQAAKMMTVLAHDVFGL
ncbi:MAG: S-layer homology domain-containing protein [Coriobacteriales bacterium]|jgi:surface antigen